MVKKGKSGRNEPKYRVLKWHCPECGVDIEGKFGDSRGNTRTKTRLTKTNQIGFLSLTPSRLGILERKKDVKRKREQSKTSRRCSGRKTEVSKGNRKVVKTRRRTK